MSQMPTSEPWPWLGASNTWPGSPTVQIVPVTPIGPAHDLTPYPKVGKFAEVRMVYCRRCGATQAVEAADRAPLAPCLLADTEYPTPTHDVPGDAGVPDEPAEPKNDEVDDNQDEREAVLDEGIAALEAVKPEETP